MPLIPLFPLEVVLFPGTGLPLHIFEPRYKEMIAECIAAKRPFGVVRAKEDSIAEVGCTAEITQIVKRYDDGRMDILAEGHERFQVLEVNHDRAFLQGEVTFLPDEPSSTTTAERLRSLELHTEVFQAMGTEVEHPEEDDDPLSYLLADDLPVDLDFKQSLLEMRSEGERLRTLIEYFEAIIPKLQQMLKARHKASGNGHVR